MGFLIRRVPLDEGSEINHCVQRLLLWCISLAFQAFVWSCNMLFKRDVQVNIAIYPCSCTYQLKFLMKSTKF